MNGYFLAFPISLFGNLQDRSCLPFLETSSHTGILQCSGSVTHYGTELPPEGWVETDFAVTQEIEATCRHSQCTKTLSRATFWQGPAGPHISSQAVVAVAAMVTTLLLSLRGHRQVHVLPGWGASCAVLNFGYTKHNARCVVNTQKLLLSNKYVLSL